MGYLNARVNEAGEVTISGLNDQQTAGAVASLVGEQIGIYGVRRDEQSLEDVFMRLTAEGTL